MDRSTIETIIMKVQAMLGPGLTVRTGSTLLGDSGLLDSMRLLELCLALEDHAREQGFDFDWTSDTAMSKFRSMFKSPQALAEEFERQRLHQAQAGGDRIK